MKESIQETPIGETSQKQQASGGGKVPASQDALLIALLDIADAAAKINHIAYMIGKEYGLNDLGIFNALKLAAHSWKICF